MILEDSNSIQKITPVHLLHNHKKMEMNDFNIHWDLEIGLLRYRVTRIDSLRDSFSDVEVNVFRIHKFMVDDFESVQKSHLPVQRSNIPAFS
jgi:hypothetical protein